MFPFSRIDLATNHELCHTLLNGLNMFPFSRIDLATNHELCHTLLNGLNMIPFSRIDLATNHELCHTLLNGLNMIPFSRHRIRMSSGSGTVRVSRQKFTLEDAIGSHTCSLEARTCV
jgi:hypothetical protein